MRLALHEIDRASIRATLIAAGCVLVALGSGFLFAAPAEAAVEPGVLMGADQKAHWDEGTRRAPSPKTVTAPTKSRNHSSSPGRSSPNIPGPSTRSSRHSREPRGEHRRRNGHLRQPQISVRGNRTPEKKTGRLGNLDARPIQRIRTRNPPRRPGRVAGDLRESAGEPDQNKGWYRVQTGEPGEGHEG